MSFFKIHIIRRLYVFILSILLFGLFWGTQSQMDQFYVVTVLEGATVYIFAFITGFVLSNQCEVEMCKCYGLKLSKLLTAQILPIFVFSVMCCVPGILLYNANSMNFLMRMQLVISFNITLAFVMAFVAFIRSLIRNTYAVLGFVMILFFQAFQFHDLCKNKLIPSEMLVLDPVLSAMMFQPDRWSIDNSVWWTNRALYFGIAVIMYVCACYIVNKRSFEDLK